VSLYYRLFWTAVLSLHSSLLFYRTRRGNVSLLFSKLPTKYKMPQSLFQVRINTGNVNCGTLFPGTGEENAFNLLGGKGSLTSGVILFCHKLGNGCIIFTVKLSN
jgi:hypothetical protein